MIDWGSVTRFRRTIVAMLCATALKPIGAAPDGVRIVTVVIDRQGRNVSGLTARDFELREDGVTASDIRRLVGLP